MNSTTPPPSRPWLLTETEWQELQGVFPAPDGLKRVGRPTLTVTQPLVEAVLYHHFHSHAPQYRSAGWHQLPRSFGVSPATANRRYRAWLADGTWLRFWDGLVTSRGARVTHPPRRRQRSPIAPLIVELERAHAFFNRRFFGGVLPSTLVFLEYGVTTRDRRSGYFLHAGCVVGGRPTDVVALTMGALRHGADSALATLLHEMAHQWNRSVGIRDTSPRQYHRAHFRDAAHLAGLSCRYGAAYGYSLTTLTDRARAAIAALAPDRRLFAQVETRRPRGNLATRRAKAAGAFTQRRT